VGGCSRSLLGEVLCDSFSFWRWRVFFYISWSHFLRPLGNLLLNGVHGWGAVFCCCLFFVFWVYFLGLCGVGGVFYVVILEGGFWFGYIFFFCFPSEGMVVFFWAGGFHLNGVTFLLFG